MGGKEFEVMVLGEFVVVGQVGVVLNFYFFVPLLLLLPLLVSLG